MKGPDVDHKDIREKLKDKYCKMYNEGAHDLKQLAVGQKVRVQDPTSKRWEKCGTIVKTSANGRSYLIEMEHERQWWRNRKFIRPYQNVQDNGRQLQENHDEDARPPPRRSSRTRKCPDRLHYA